MKGKERKEESNNIKSIKEGRAKGTADICWKHQTILREGYIFFRSLRRQINTNR